MEFTERIMGMITKPDDTTKDIDKDPRIEEGLMMVGVYMILLVLATYISLSRVRYTGSIQGFDAATLATYMVMAGIAGVIVTTLAGWAIATGVLHLLSLFFGASGKFYPNMMTLIGYAAIPLTAVTLISMVLSLLTPVTVVDISMGAQSSASSVFGSPLQILGMVVELLGSLWVAYMMVFGVKNGEKLPMDKALIVVGVLFVLNLLMSYGSIALTLLS